MDQKQNIEITSYSVTASILRQIFVLVPTQALHELAEKFIDVGLSRTTEHLMSDTRIQVENYMVWFHLADLVAQHLPDDFPNREGFRDYIANCAFNGFGID